MVEALVRASRYYLLGFFFFQAEDGIRDLIVTGVQTCALPISRPSSGRRRGPRDRSSRSRGASARGPVGCAAAPGTPGPSPISYCPLSSLVRRSEEHTSELQSRSDLVCRLLLEKKKNNNPSSQHETHGQHHTSGPHDVARIPTIFYQV